MLNMLLIKVFFKGMTEKKWRKVNTLTLCEDVINFLMGLKILLLFLLSSFSGKYCFILFFFFAVYCFQCIKIIVLN